MTPQHEQWECDLIAPSAAPGLTDAKCRAIAWERMANRDPSRLEIACIRAGYATAAGQAHPQGQAMLDAKRWRVIECCLIGDNGQGTPEFATLIAEIAYSHQIDIGIVRSPTPTTLQLIDELAEGYKRGDDAARAAIAKESP